MSAERAVRRVLLALLVTLLAAACPVNAAAGPAAAVEVEISGLRGEPLDNARASLSLLRRQASPGQASPGQASPGQTSPGQASPGQASPGLTEERIRTLHDRAPAEIARALEPFGYYRAEIQSELQAPQREGGPWVARYRVAAGSQVPLDEVDIELAGPGDKDPDLQAALREQPLVSGAPLDHRQYEAVKRELLRTARESGYLDADLAEHRVEVNLDEYRADIRLQLATGPLYRVGAIRFEQTSLSRGYLDRFLVLAPGAPFRSAALAEQRRILGRSGHFREVDIQQLPAEPGSPTSIPLLITLQPFKSNRYRGRLGWGTDTGFGVQLDWTRRYVGRRGQQFTVGAAAVEERNKLAADLNYVIPLQPVEKSRLEFSARHEGKDLTFKDVELEVGGETRIETNLLGFDWYLSGGRWRDFELQLAPRVNLVSESYDVFEVLFGHLPGNLQDVVINNIGAEAYDTLSPEFDALVPGLALTLRRSDSRLFIRDGDYVKAQFFGASEALGSNISFWQARLDSWHIRPVRDAGRLLLRFGLGYSDAESREVLLVNFNKLPEYYEFRAGGARSIRGYGFEALVPEGSITGGKHQLIASVEYEHEIIPDWSAALFLDAGNTFNSWSAFEPVHGVGVGARWRSPVGLVRVDLGVPLDDAEDSFQVYITVGPEF